MTQLHKGRSALPQPLSDSARSLARALNHEALDREKPHARRQTMPGFADLARDIVEIWGPHPGAVGEISRLLRDMGRFAAGNWAIYLEATPGGLTTARMSESLKRTTVSGPGRARALLAYLRFIGYVEPASDVGDGRTRHFRTTVKMREAFQDRIRRELEVRARLDPAIPALLARFDSDPSAFDAFFVTISEVSFANMELAAPRKNELDLFSDRYAGLIILCEMLQRGEPGDGFLPRGPLDFTVAGLAMRCDTSRMQVNALLSRARQAGYLIPTADGRERLSEPLLRNMEGLIAGTTDMVIGCARIVMGGPATIFD
ncbi:MAG: hypothetical protein ACOYM5_17290 [Caulobacter sp.]